MKKRNIILFNSYFSFYFFQNLTNFDIDSYQKVLQSNLGYPNVDYPKLLGYSKTTDSPDFFSLLSIAIKLPVILISIIRKINFFEVIRRSRLKKLLLKYPSRFEVQSSRKVTMISLFWSSLSD